MKILDRYVLSEFIAYLAMGLLAFIGVWRLGRLLGGPRAGFLAMLFLVLTPAYYGQMFYNPKDIPFAVGYVWALFYLTRLARAWPRLDLSLGLSLAATMALAASVRIAGLLTMVYAVLLGATHLIRQFARTGSREAAWKARRVANETIGHALTPEAALTRRVARAEPQDAYALAEARIYSAAAAGALRAARRARARLSGRRRATPVRSAGRAARDRA